MKEQYLKDTFGIQPDDSLVEDFSCWFDALHAAHMYLTKQHLCWHVHGQKGQEKTIAWSTIQDIVKKNTAKVIPNAVVVTAQDKTEYFFAFINRNHTYKVMHKLWKGKDHSDKCSHEHDQSHASTFSPLHPEYETKEDLSASVKEVPDTESLPSISDVKIEENYDIKKVLGTGAFSTVKLATRKKNGVEYAIKIIDKQKVGDKKEMLDREVDILRRIRHPNVISVQEIYETSSTLYLVMELATGGELFDEIVKRGKYSEDDAARMVKQITEAISYLHSKGIVHRDLKPENLLLASKTVDSIIKIADFGLSKVMEAAAVLQTACGTPGYVAPEVLMGEGYNEEVDVWSIGVILYILLCGFPPFYAENNNKLFEKIMSGSYQFLSPYWDKVSESAKDLIRHLLVVDPSKRYNSMQLLHHPWIQGHTTSKEDLLGALEHLKKTKSQESRVTMLASSSVARMALNA